MNGNAFLGVFPFLFIGMWLGITSLLSLFSGWRTLQTQFPDRDEIPTLRLRMQSAQMGRRSRHNPWGGVSYGSCLRFDVCPTGLRVAVWRIFGIFDRPFLVPWNQIAVERRKVLFVKRYSLRLGNTGITLTIRDKAYQRIAANSPLGAASI